MITTSDHDMMATSDHDAMVEDDNAITVAKKMMMMIMTIL